VSGGNPSVRVATLAVFDDGTGPALYAAGDFTLAGGAAASRIARWNGASWSVLGTGTNDRIAALAVFDSGSGPALYAGGSFTSAGAAAAIRFARWDGAAWSSLGGGLSSWVLSIAVFDDGTGPALYAGGSFPTAGGVATTPIARWDGNTWSALGSGVSGFVGATRVFALAVFDDGTGPALYAGGDFLIAGGVAVNHIARWDGSSWSALGSGMSGSVSALAVFDGGSGPALYAGGDFDLAGGVTVNRIARWDGNTWSALGTGTGGSVAALEVLDDGSGPALYAGGSFEGIIGVSGARRIARWNGSNWSALGTGIQSNGGSVDAIAVFDDGSGPAIYAGGSFQFSVGGLTAIHIARWNGSTWSALGSGVSGADFPRIFALAAFDDGSGPALYAGGDFTVAGGVAANYLARWDGSGWSPVGGGMTDRVWALEVLDDGSGPALHVGGAFSTSLGGDSYLAKWGGCSGLGFQTEPGCFGNPAELAAKSLGLVLGQPASFKLTATAGGSGVGLLYAGSMNVDAQGCGVLLPGLGEYLLAIAVGPLPLASGPAVGGVTSLSFTVPNLPQLVGLPIGLQGVHVALSVPGTPIELSNALVGTFAP